MRYYDRLTQAVLQRPAELAQYTSVAFGTRCREAGVRPSMGRVGDAYDNALCESFFATLKCELLLDRQRFRTQGGGAPGHLRLHRGLVQSAPPAFESRLLVAHRL